MTQFPPGGVPGPAPAEPLPALTFEGAWSLGMRAFKENYGLLVGVSFLMLGIGIVDSVVSEALAQVDPLAQALWAIALGLGVSIPLTAGTVVLGGNMVRRGRGSFDDLFVGYKRFGALLGWTLLAALVAVACIGPGVLGIVLLERTSGRDTAMVVGLVLAVVYLVAGVCIGTRFYPVGPMLVDPAVRRMSVLETAKASWRMTGEMRWLTYFALMLACGLVLVASLLLLCVGLPLLGYPIYFGVMGAAYAMLTEDLRVGSERCPRCGYNLTGLGGLACPECGSPRGF